MTDLFTLAIEDRDKRIADLQREVAELRLVVASGLGYFRSHRAGDGIQGAGVRKLMRKSLERVAN